MAGQLADTITYLEMTARPLRPPRPAPAAKLALLRAERCTVSFYRYLYNTVGEPWLWFERRLWTDEHLRAHLARDDVEVFVLYAGGVPAGYYELQRTASGDTQLCYFGLVPDFIGRRLGLYFLQSAVDNAWLGATARVWVHTSTYDHPRALGLYQRAGFRVYQRRDILFDDPRLTGVLPRGVVHPRLPPLAS
ncbi:MAG TPA: GNAT family N-acetyltransferase [Stellaceae bacterium]